MKLSEIWKQVNRDIDDSFANADITDWVNRCLDELTPIAKKEKKQSFTISNIAFTLPTDLHEIAFVLVNQEEYKLLDQRECMQGYKVWGSDLNLSYGPETGTLDLFYYKRLSHIANPDDVPEIEEEFHDLLILYAIARSQYEDEEFEDQSIAMNEYRERKREYEIYIKKRRSLGRVRRT